MRDPYFRRHYWDRYDQVISPNQQAEVEAHLSMALVSDPLLSKPQKLKI